MVTRQFTHSSTFANGGEYVLIKVFSIPIATVLFNGDLSRKNVFISRCLVAQFTCGDLLCCDTCLNKILNSDHSHENYESWSRSLSLTVPSNSTSLELLYFWNRGWFRCHLSIDFAKLINIMSLAVLCM